MEQQTASPLSHLPCKTLGTNTQPESAKHSPEAKPKRAVPFMPHSTTA